MSGITLFLVAVGCTLLAAAAVVFVLRPKARARFDHEHEKYAAALPDGETQGPTFRRGWGDVLAIAGLIIGCFGGALILEWDDGADSSAEQVKTAVPANPSPDPFPSTELFASLQAAVRFNQDNVNSVKSDQAEGHPPTNQGTWVQEVVETIQYGFIDDPAVSFEQFSAVEIELKGSFNFQELGAALTPTLYVEIGRHRPDEQIGLGIRDLTNDVEMTELPERCPERSHLPASDAGSWRIYKREDITPPPLASDDREEAVVEVTPHWQVSLIEIGVPVLDGRANGEFHIRLRYQTRRHLIDQISPVWYVGARDFGQADLQNVRVSIRWPYKIQETGKRYQVVRKLLVQNSQGDLEELFHSGTWTWEQPESVRISHPTDLQMDIEVSGLVDGAGIGIRYWPAPVDPESDVEFGTAVLSSLRELGYLGSGN